MQLHKNAKVELLRRVPLFAHCSKQELAAVAAVADETDFPEGKELTRQGKPGREFLVLIAGRADVRQNGHTLATLTDGDFFGEIALVTGRPRTATVVAATPVRVLVITDRSFRALLERSPGIRDKVMRALAERVVGDDL